MKRVIVSGHFNPLHGGHLDLIEAARLLGDQLIVIVNNDKQAYMKKGKIILDENNRLRLVKALADVDEAMLSIDTIDTSQCETIKYLRELYPEDELIYANGGDRSDNAKLPENECSSCEECDIKMVFGVGSKEVEKRDSSTRIIRALGIEI